MLSYVIMCLISFSCSYAQDPIINSPQGRVVGIKVYSDHSPTPIEIFFGIPYASPPIGRLRFSPPERHPGWQRTLFAHKMPPRCPGPGEDMNNISEDCLYLNIWTSRSEIARGNLALLDQYMALLWVKENIAAFGGDSTSVTLIGHTAGADSVLYHIFSPRSIGLFHRAIIMSPQDTTLWKSVDSNTDDDATFVESVSRTLGDFLGCRNKTDREILLCMKSLPIQRFAELYSNTNWTNAFCPTSDNFLPLTEQYLPLSLSAALAAVKSPNIQLDVLMGTTQLEALYFRNNDRYENIKQSSSRLFEYASTIIIPELLKTLSLDQSESFSTLIQATQWEYFGVTSLKNEKNILKATESIARMETSAKWGAGCALLAARLARRISRLYVYRFSEPFTVDLSGKALNFTGAVHGTDLLAFLGDPLMLQIARRHSTLKEREMSIIFRQYLINFIKYGSPGPESEWPRYIVGDANIQNICRKDSNNICDNHDIKKEIAFWLQYLPRLSQTLGPLGRTEKITSEKDDSRLRGGVFAMCGVSAVLVLLLFISVLLLHKRNRRLFDENTQTHL